jgi:hypothetical protein
MRKAASIGEALELFVPPFVNEPQAWDDVLRRVGDEPPAGSRLLRRPLLLAAVLLVAVGLAASAYALGRHFLVGDPAPPEVEKQASLLQVVKGELIPRVQDSAEILVERTRAGAVLQASTGYVYLWVAPAKDGGECRFLHIVGIELPDGRPNLSGGCHYGGSALDAEYSMTNVGGRELRLLAGSASEQVARLEIVYPGGRNEFRPVKARHFLLELDDRPTSVAALDEAGDVLARQRFLTMPGFPRPSGPARTLISARTPSGQEISLRVAAGPKGTQCEEIRTPGGVSTGCARWELEPTEIAVSPMQVGTAPNGLFLLEGKMGSAIASLELHFENGETVRLPLVDGWSLYQVTREHFAEGQRPELLVGKDREGRVISRERLGPWAT